MKRLVLASYAQFGVDAGGKHFRACIFRAISNGMENPTLLMWRPVSVHQRTPGFGIFDWCTGQD